MIFKSIEYNIKLLDEDGKVRYNTSSNNKQETKQMNKTINYTQDWYVDISEMSEEEWNQLMAICDSKGVEVYSKQYERDFRCLIPHNNGLERCGCACYERVSILEMFNRLERPIKSAQQVKIEELETAIKEAIEQIQEIKSRD